MKKIVALVLSLVMALSLCAVAFAANTYTDAKIWTKVNAIEYKWEDYDLDGKAVSYTSAKETMEGKKVVSGSLAYYTIGDLVGKYVEVAKADATFQMKVNGKVVYLAVADIIDYTAVGKSVKAGTKCGDYDKDVYKDDVLMEVDGDLYYKDENGTVAVLLDGTKVVMATEDTDPVKVQHEWATLDGKLVADWNAMKLAEAKATVLCKNCNVKATVTNDKAAIPTNATIWAVPEYDVYMYWVDGAADSTTTDKDGVESAKTFDAGIAMYVGMSLLSVAGGAVVIGKKKEF